MIKRDRYKKQEKDVLTAVMQGIMIALVILGIVGVAQILGSS